MGEHIPIRLAVLSNFHVQSILIGATVYFKIIFKGLNNFLKITGFILIQKYIKCNCYGYTESVPRDVKVWLTMGPHR